MSPEAEPNYKSICRQLQQKNQQLGKAYQDLKAQFDELEDQLAQAQQDADEMADLVRQNELEMTTYKDQMKSKDDRIKTLEQQLRTLQNSEPPAATNHESAGRGWETRNFQSKGSSRSAEGSWAICCRL